MPFCNRISIRIDRGGGGGGVGGGEIPRAPKGPKYEAAVLHSSDSRRTTNEKKKIIRFFYVFITLASAVRARATARTNARSKQTFA